MTMSLREFVAQVKTNTLKIPVPTCARCGEELQESITGCRKTGDGFVCSDCYYEMFGEIVASAPITTARIRKG